MAGFLWGWVEFWIIRSASIAALATMFTESVHVILKQTLHPGETGDVLSFWPRQLLTACVIAALGTVNARGTKLGAGLQVFVTSVKVGSLLFIIVLPFAVLAAVSQPAAPPRVANLTPVWPAGLFGVNWGLFGAALVGVLWAYHGWMNIAPIAEEVRRQAGAASSRRTTGRQSALPRRLEQTSITLDAPAASRPPPAVALPGRS